MILADGKADKDPQTRSKVEPATLADSAEGSVEEFVAVSAEEPGSVGEEANPGEYGRNGKRDGYSGRQVSGERASRSVEDPGPDSSLYRVPIRERASGRVPEIFVVTSGCEGPVLPVFSSDEAARDLLNSPTKPGEESGWRVREARAGELISVLSASGLSAGPCAGVEKIALDLPAEILQDQSGLLSSLTVDRRYFLKSLLGREKRPVQDDRRWVGEAAREASEKSLPNEKGDQSDYQ